MTTTPTPDAGEPAFLTSLLHIEECGFSMLYDVYANEVCGVADIVNHIDTLTAQLAAAKADGGEEDGAFDDDRLPF